MMKKLTFILLAVLMASVGWAQNTLVTPPADVEQEDWTLTCNEVDYQGNSTPSTYQAKVAIQDNDIYIQGLAFDGAWVKGTIGDGTVTIPTHQYVGSYQGTALYQIGYQGEGSVDIVFSYDAEKGVMATATYILLIDGNDNTYGQMTDVTLSKGSAPEESESWTLTCKNVNPSNEEQFESVSEPISVNISGSDITITGLSGFDPTAPLRGTINGNTATFAKGQSAGNYNSTSLYFIGFAGGTQDIDIVFDYNVAAGVLTAQSYILCISSDGSTYQMLTDVVITKGGGDNPQPGAEDEPVVVPDNLSAQDYLFTGSNIVYAQDGSIDHMDKVEWPVKVAFYGDNEIYVRGLAEIMPGAWVKGTIEKDSWDVEMITFPRGQFLGKGITSVYLAGMSSNVLADYILEIQNQRAKLHGKSFMVINSSKSALAPYYVYAGTELTKLTPVAATPAAPVIERYQEYLADEGYAALMLTIPTKDVNGKTIAPSCLGYRLITEKDGQQQVYTFTNNKYVDLPEADMTVIPYDFGTGYNFYIGGSLLYINDNLEQNDRLGVQSVYTVGSKVNDSEITWMSFSNADGLSTASDNLRVESETYTDLQGRRATSATRGFVIKTERLSNGTVRSTKILNK